MSATDLHRGADGVWRDASDLPNTVVTSDGVTLIRGSDDYLRWMAGDKAANRDGHVFVGTQVPRYLTPLSAYSTEPAPPLLLDRLDPIGPTILYGPGGSRKGALAVSWAKRLMDGDHRVAILDYEDHAEEWSRRLHGLGGDGDSLLHLAPLRAYPATDRRAMPGLAGHFGHVRAELDEQEIDYIIVDSAVMAAPGEPGSPLSAQAYFAAIQMLGRPNLTLAHTNKAGDLSTPFGTSYWHNLARMTWSLVEDGPDRSKLHNRKHNNYDWQGSYAVTTTWLDGILREVWERPYSVTITERITEALAAGPATLDDIVATLDSDEGGEPVKRNSIVQVLRRGLTTHRSWTIDGELWSMRGGE